MNILLVGNILKDVYLNLDNRTELFETDRDGTKWLDLSFNASKHHFFHRTTSFGGAAVSLEVLQNLGLSAKISNSPLDFTNVDPDDNTIKSVSAYRYIFVNDEQVTYFTPSNFPNTIFASPESPVDYLYVDRSALITSETAEQILSFLNTNPKTKLILYVTDTSFDSLTLLIPHANLIFSEKPDLNTIDPQKIVYLSHNHFSYQNITETFCQNRIDVMTHLSIFSIAAATILGCFILGYSVEESLKFARVNLENSKLHASLTLDQLKQSDFSSNLDNSLELIAANLLIHPKGILAADESGGSINKKFSNLNIPDTYQNRRDYRNLFFTTENLEDYVNGVILFDETARQLADNGQNFVDFLTAHRIIPGIKVDQGLENFDNSDETYTKGLDGLKKRLAEYYNLGLRFAKWRAAFKINPSDYAIHENAHILAEYASACQKAGLVPIVEPEIVFDGYFSIDDCFNSTARVLDELFKELSEHHVNLRACILKINMVLAGKQFEHESTEKEVGLKTSELLKAHVPESLAGVVFLSGGQTPERATKNLAAILKNGPFPWPITFSFARALQDPALYAWSGDPNNADAARAAFKARLQENQEALLSQIKN